MQVEINEAAKQFNFLVLGLIKQASNKINRLAWDRISRIINQGGQQIERIAPKVIKEATEDVDIGKPKLGQVKRKLKSIIKRINHKTCKL